MTNTTDKLKLCLETIKHYKDTIVHDFNPILCNIDSSRYNSILDNREKIVSALDSTSLIISEYINEGIVFEFDLDIFYGRSKKELNRMISIKVDKSFDEFDDTDGFLEYLIKKGIVSEEDADHVITIYRK